MIGKALTLTGTVDGGSAPATTLQPTGSANKLIQIDGTGFGADETVTIQNLSINGASGGR